MKNKILYPIIILLISGCATGNKAQVQIKPEGQANFGMNNTSSKNETTTTQNAGRDITQGSKVGGNMTNDPKLMEQYISALKEQVLESEKNRAAAESENKTLYKYIIGQFMVLLLKAYVIIYFVIRKLFTMMEKSEEAEEKRMDKLIEKETV